MTEDRIARWAALLVDYCLRVEAGETILIASELEARPLVEACYRLVVDRGAHPIVRVALPGLGEYLIARGDDDQLGHLSPIAVREAEVVDGRIGISAETDTRSMRDVDPRRLALRGRSQAPLRELSGRKRWVITQYPTSAYAADAGMAMGDYEAYVARSMFLDRADPVVAWQDLGRRQAGLVESMAGVREVRIEGEGTDLTLSVAGRTWINSDGRRNMPSGEIFTGPVEDSARGRLRCSFPVCRGGREVVGIELEFEGGRVVAGPGRRRRGLPALDARPRRRGPLTRRARPRPERGDRPLHRLDPLRREDRRDGAPRPRQQLPRDRRDQQLGPALGPDRRPPRAAAGSPPTAGS